MFCDLVGSTALSEQLDPEDLREVMFAYRDVCSKVINRFEGYIAQFLGDGLLVYFGYPVAHEDDAHRAVRTGLGIVEAIKNLNSVSRKKEGREAGCRLGIHTGLVVAGDMATGEPAPAEGSCWRNSQCRRPGAELGGDRLDRHQPGHLSFGAGIFRMPEPGGAYTQRYFQTRGNFSGDLRKLGPELAWMWLLRPASLRWSGGKTNGNH